MAGRWREGREINLGLPLLDQLLPFALVLQNDRICHAGASIGTCLQRGSLVGKALGELMRLIEPVDGPSLGGSALADLVNRPLRLEAERRHDNGTISLTFAGQLLPLQRQHWLLALAPLPDSLDDLHRYGLTLQDLPLQDPFRQTFVERLMADGLHEVLSLGRPEIDGRQQPEGTVEDLEALLGDGAG
jgi:hypothetical protein